MKRPRLKISTKVSLLFVILVLFQGAVTLVTLTVIVSRSQNEAYRSQMNHTVRGIKGYLQEVLDEQRINANLLSGQVKIIDYTDFGLKNLLQRELAIYRSSLRMGSIAVYLEPGVYFTGVGETFASSWISREELAAAFSGGDTIFITAGPEKPALTVFSTIERDGRVIGLLGLSRSLDEEFVEKIQTLTSTTIVFSFAGRRISMDDISDSTVDKIVHMPEMQDEPEEVKILDEYMVAAIPMEVWGQPQAVIHCLIDTTEYRRLIARYNSISLISTFLILTLALIIGLVFYRVTFNRPFKQLLEAVYRISEGNLQEDFQTGAEDEFGDLAKAFNKMRVNLVNRERELLQLSLYNTLILENVPTGIVTVNLEKRVTSFNSAAVRILGEESSLPIGAVIEPEDGSGAFPAALSELLTEGLRNDRYSSGREIIFERRGWETILSVSTAPLLSKDREKIGTIGIFEDVTKVKQLEQKLTISTRLAALGEMAAGVAHQIRNPLGVMKVSAEMLRDDFKVTSKRANYSRITHMIVNEIDTLNLVIRNLLDFAKPREAQMQLCSIGDLVRSSLGNLPLDNYPNLQIELVDLEEVPERLMDKNLMEQALSNILLNAMQASPEHGTVRIGAELVDGDLHIWISDQGEGLSEATRNKIFNPFYTTKAAGTGLGLSIAHQIVEKHKGSIDVFSETGKGTTFRIVL